MIIPVRFNGPRDSANGGYACGLLARSVEGVAEVTLRRPPPLGRVLEVRERDDGGAELLDSGTLVAEARPVELELDVPEPVTLGEARAASGRFPGHERHAFPACFVCGPIRDDGLRLFPGPVEGRDIVAAPWWSAQTPSQLVWAALDCPSGWAVTDFGEPVLLGRMAAKILRTPEADEPHVVVGWPIDRDGRKLEAGSALFTREGELVAFARATWIAPPG